jgi:hypothetical protein
VEAGYGAARCPDGKVRRIRNHYTVLLEGRFAGRAWALLERGQAQVRAAPAR